MIERLFRIVVLAAVGLAFVAFWYGQKQDAGLLFLFAIFLSVSFRRSPYTPPLGEPPKYVPPPVRPLTQEERDKIDEYNRETTPTPTPTLGELADRLDRRAEESRRLLDDDDTEVDLCSDD